MLRRLLGNLRIDQEREKELFQGAQEEVRQANSSVLRMFSLMTAFLLGILFLISFIDYRFTELRWPYGIVCVAATALYLFFRWERSMKVVLAGIYFYGTMMFLLGNYLSAIVSPFQAAAALIALVIIIPLLILDKSSRIDAYMLLICLASILISAVYKPMQPAIDDLVNLSCFGFCGLLFGRNIRMTKLLNFESRRLLLYQRNVDALTGLSNRRRLFEALQEYEGNGGDKALAGVIMLDIDYYKRYNDQYGHLDGDECLQRLGGFFREFGQSRGLEFYRYGGEEFIALCFSGPESGRDGWKEPAVIAAELCAAVRALEIPHAGSAYGTVTVSAGAAASEENAEGGYERLLAMADEALYCAKKRGRNRAVGFSEATAAEEREGPEEPVEQ